MIPPSVGTPSASGLTLYLEPQRTLRGLSKQRSLSVIPPPMLAPMLVKTGWCPAMVGARWDAAAPSLVDINMETIAVRRFDALLALISGLDLASDPSDARATSFEAVYNAHYRDVSRHVILITRGRDDVEEIVAETFARAFAAWRSGNGPAGRPLPWLLVIARRIATDRWRRRRLISWLPLPDGRRSSPNHWDASTQAELEPGGPDSAAGSAEFWLWLDALSKALPARQRDVIFLRYQRDLTDEDIGEVLCLSTSGVRTLASRALGALRRHPELWS